MERQVIADVIQSPYMMGDVQQLIHKGFFTNPDRQSIWELIEDHYNKGLSFDMQTIATRLLCRHLVPGECHESQEHRRRHSLEYGDPFPTG